MAEGHKSLITPYNTAEFYALVNEITEHHGQMSMQSATVAADLRKLLANPLDADGRPVKFAAARADLRVKATMVVRPLAHAASLNTALVKAYKQAWVNYLRLYTNQGQTGGHGRKFTVN
jgi:hypothetical protein